VSESGRSTGSGQAHDDGTIADPLASRVRQALSSWRRWRRTRPFWGGLLVLLGSAEILLSERGPLPLVVHIGVQGLAGYLVPLIMLLCGLLLWFNPLQRLFYSLLAVMLALASWGTSNLGGFFAGLLLGGVAGGALAFAWTTAVERRPAWRWLRGRSRCSSEFSVRQPGPPPRQPRAP
jgi:hypothetical protein